MGPHCRGGHSPVQPSQPSGGHQLHGFNCQTLPYCYRSIWYDFSPSSMFSPLHVIWLWQNCFYSTLSICKCSTQTSHFYSTQMFLLDTSKSPCQACIVLLSSNLYHHEDWSLSRWYILLLGKFFLMFQRIVQPSSSGSGLKEVMKMKALQSLEV